jgi:hypothetical protein
VRTSRAGRAWKIVVLLAGGLSVHGAAPAFACSCVDTGDRSLAESVAAADGAFVGTVTRIERPGLLARFLDHDPEVDHHFAVEAVAAGAIGRTVVVRAGTNSSSCGLQVEPGRRIGLFVSRQGDEWTAGLCSTEDPDELAAIAGPPNPSIGPPIDVAWPATGALAALAAVVIALARTGAGTRHDPAGPLAAGS